MSKKHISHNEAAAILEVTAATIKNWQRLGRLSEQLTREEVLEVKASGLLRSRRNKTNLKRSQTCRSYIDGHYELKKLLSLPISEHEIPIILAEAALRLLSPGQSRLTAFLKGELSAGEADPLIRGLLRDAIPSENTAKITAVSWEISPEADALGFIYISLLPLSRRHLMGAYYTPIDCARKAVDKVDLSGTVLDPSCGSGSFLLAAAEKLGSPLTLRAMDIDPVAVSIARFNLYLRYPGLGTDYLQKNITVKSFFDEKSSYDVIIGNPPWGGRPELSGRFLLHTLNCLKTDGRFSLILPQSLLTTRIHPEVRRSLLSQARLLFADYLKNCFYGVYCPSVILCGAKSAHPGVQGCVVNSEFTISKREIDPRCLNLNVTDEESTLLLQMKNLKNAARLKGSATFALGIVTGGNKGLVSPTDGEPLIRGTDITPFAVKEPSAFLTCDITKCQQWAPREIYEAKEKIVYRFIGRRPVFAVDRLGRLSLNSCNIIIPHIAGLDIDYITAVLNSSAVGFFLEKSFACEKWLRWQLEEIPIPVVSREIQKEICNSPNWDQQINELYFGSL